MDSQALITNDYRLDGAQRFAESIANNQFYFFVGNALNPNNIVTPLDNPNDTLLDAYYGMLFGKQINANDAQLMVKRYDYVANTVYAMYDHTSASLYDSNFYVTVQDGTQYDVFKCLDNNNGSPSTIIPARANVNFNNDDFYYPNDGYRWKYLYSVDTALVNKFATADYFPVVTDAGVSAAATNGAIDVISVVTAGKGYANYIQSGSFGVGDIRLNGNPLMYGISVPNISGANGFYDACWLYVSSGPGAGQYRQIESYSANSTSNWVELTDPFDPSDPPQNTSRYEIYPSVKITGDGSETTAATARAIIDPTSNSVNHVEMLDRGINYNSATATVMYSASVGVVTESVIKPIYSPKRGHGFNPPEELGGHYLGFGLSLTDDENGTILTQNDYSQWGLLKNPEFRKVSLSLTGMNQQFGTNELVYKYDPTQLVGVVSTNRDANNTLTNVLQAQGVDPSQVYKAGMQLLLRTEDSYQVANIAGLSNTSIYLDKNATIDTTGAYTANVYLAGLTSSGLVDGFQPDRVVLTECSSDFAVGDTIIGIESGTVGTIASIQITDTAKGFSTFLQAYTYIGSMQQGSFTPDEEVYQIAEAISNARFHSIVADSVSGTSKIYTTYQKGIFNTSTGNDVNLSDEIIGDSSGAIAKLTQTYLPDLIFGSGQIVYLENFTPITRSDEKSETFKLVLNF